MIVNVNGTEPPRNGVLLSVYAVGTFSPHMSLSRLVLLASAVRISARFQPQQIHLAFGGEPDSIAVDFATDADVNCTSTGVAFGTSPAALNMFVPASSCYYFAGALQWQSQVKLTGLKAGTTYYYTAGSPAVKYVSWSEMYSFVMPDTSPTSPPQRVAIFADFGYFNSESLPALIAGAYTGAYDWVIHAGDIAYDMDWDGGFGKIGAVGSEFLLAIEPIAATRPYMVSPGNHECANNFTHYRNRFAALTNFTAKASGSPSNLFYSFDSGLAHYISVDTELFDEFEGGELVHNMLTWLEADLTKANANRHIRPWVMAFGHKCSYMAQNSSLWESLFYIYGVDMYFCGHVHSYRRWLPFNPMTNVYDKAAANKDASVYTNPRAVVPIVTGAAGCQEPPAAHCNNDPKSTSPSSCGNYGFGILEIANATHAHWTWNTTVPLNGSSAPKFSDDLWVIVDKHGPRTTQLGDASGL